MGLFDNVLRPVAKVIKAYNKACDAIGEVCTDFVYRWVFEPGIAALNRYHDHRHPPNDMTAWWERYHRVTALSIGDAKEEFFALLAEGKAYVAVEEPSSDPALDDLAPEVRSLLSRYREIKNRASLGTFSLSRKAMLQDDIAGPDFICIGEEDSGHMVAFVKRHSEDIYTIEGDFADLDEPAHRSVYHWLILAYDPELAMLDEDAE